MTIEELKQHIDIVDVISDYTDLKGTGNRLRAMLNPIRDGGDFDVYKDTQKWYDQGTGEGGDIIDFARQVKQLNIAEAIAFLKKNYLGSATSSKGYKHEYRTLPKLKEPVQTAEEENNLIKGLEQMATRYLATYPGKTWSCFTLDIEGIINDQSVVQVAPIFRKLFEGQHIPTDKKFAKYLFDKIIGYDPYFNCPMIIIRDESERVVDLVRYRPKRDGIPLKQKYLVARNKIKPHERGRNFIFPFQQQMMKIAHKEGYCFVGEGLKNAINASLGGIPFISIESASNISQRLIDFLNGPRMKGVQLIGAMDGDTAGEKAYIKIYKEIHLSKNIFDFSSGVDFTNYLKNIREEKLYGSKKAS